MIFSRRAQNLVGSLTMSATLKAQEKIKNGEDIVLASVGEPEVPAPNAAKEEILFQIQNREAKYGSAQGLLSTRQAIATWMSELYDQKWGAEQVALSPGSKFSLFALMQILCDEQDEVIIPAPYWVSYETLAKLAGASVKIIPTSFADSYKISAARLASALSPQSKILLLNSPQNPSGAVYSREELQEIAEVLTHHPQLVVICDDIYNQLIFSNNKRSPHLLDVLPSSLHERAIVVHGASKSFAMTGWRLGWTVGSPELIKKLTDFQSQTLTSMPDFIQHSLQKTLEKEQTFVQNLRLQIHKKHQRALEVLQNCPALRVFVSEGAFYVWMEVLSTDRSSSALCEDILQKTGVALVPGSAFGLEYHLRLSVTLPEETLEKGLQRLLQYFNGDKK